ncbi:MAG: penicillin acylase family protein, partial [Verrucomicrobia bacterium]|nr:penicillin acylase family protein [Verrucomicrobiota bacterium]
MTILLRLLIGTLAAVVGLALVAVTAIYLLLSSSLPSYDGQHTSRSIQETVTIERDDLGVPNVHSSTRKSVSYGIGFSHAQDRYFQMDMQRRVAAGELAALIGPGAIPVDKRARIHGFRERAKLVCENLTDAEKTILEYYTRGVNEGLKSLTTRPPEYWLLKSKPSPWLPEDSILVIYAFYLDLQDNPELDYARWVARQTLPEEVVQFLDPPSHSWEAALDNSTLPQPEIPGAESFSYLKATPSDSAFLEIPDAAERMPGSNNWVVGPEVSVNGFPILADDPHLNLGVPNSWYKLSYSYIHDETKTPINAHGFSIPGLPGIVIGTNGHIAWGITNSSLDIDDLIILEPGENGFPEYKTPTGTALIQQRKEIIEVRGAGPVTIEVPFTQWGPIVGETPTGEKRVRRWVAYHPDAANLRSLMTEHYTSTEQFLDRAYEINLPAQNFVVADKEGHIAWTLAGFLPDRQGANPYEAIYSSKAHNIWTKKHPSNKWPAIKDPKNNRLWTANNRVAGDEDYLSFGNAGFSEYPRAYQIREKLLAQEKHSPRSMAAIQHDNTVTFLIRWQKLLLHTLEAAEKPKPEFKRFQEEVEAWSGRAEKDSIGYTLIRDFRNRLTAEIINHITQPGREFDPEGFDPFRFMTEEAVSKIVTQQPEYLLNPIYDSWQHQLEQVVSELTERIRSRGWEAFRWGNRNRSDYRHPITYAIPALNGLLSMPQIALEGDYYCPKVLSHSLSGGVRMIVSPGKLEDSIFQMGCGQSGHPLSPHYRDLHAHWTEESYLPFLPGEV